MAVIKLNDSFALLEDKKQAWEDLIRLTADEYRTVREGAASVLGTAFSYVPDKKQAWKDLIRLTDDEYSDVRLYAAYALGAVFSHVPDKKQAWEDLHRLTANENIGVRLHTVSALGTAFSHIPDKKQAWEDLHRFVTDENSYVRQRAAEALGTVFSQVLDKKQAWEDMIDLTVDKDSDVRASAYNSLGRTSIFKVANAENNIDIRKELEEAIKFFEQSSEQETFFKPAKFCLPFYRSFYAITFKKHETEAEVQRYLSEAKSAVEGSESREKLFEAVENLGNALKEAQKERDFDELKSDLNAYRRYCDRACELLDTAEEKAPGASRLIRKGLPIIDERIKGIITEIQEKAKAACQQSIGTPAGEIACGANKEIQQLRIENPEKMIWAVENIIFVLHTKIPHNPENKNIHDWIEEIRKEEDMTKQYQMIAILIAMIPSANVQIGNINVSGSLTRININSEDRSINIIGDRINELEKLIEKDYKKNDKNELVQTVHQMKQYCEDPSKKDSLKEKLQWIITRTSEIASISSLAIALQQML